MTSNVLYLPQKSILFDGSADYLKIDRQGSGVANLNPTGTDAFSVSAWFHPYDVQTRVIMSNQETASPYEGFACLFTNSQLRFSWYTAAGTNRYARTNYNTAFYERNQWHCAVFTYDGSDDSSGLQIFLNGCEQELTYVSTGAIGAVDSSDSVRIGAANWGGQFDGYLNNVAFWNKQLTKKEITEIYRGRGGAVGPGDLRRHSATANCIGWWIADNPSDTYNGTIYDQKGSFNMTPISLASDALEDLAL